MSNAPSHRSLALRGRLFRAVALAPTAPLPVWLEDLDAALRRSPTLLRGRAVILDVAALTGDDVSALLVSLGERRIRVLGLEGTDDARDDRPPVLVGGHPAGEIAVPPAEPATVASLTIEGSVRSGQTIVHPEGDVTVMGSVSSGAEILAGGSIHVYGALRGRAIAGAARNPRARIYCRKFEPELLGIDRLVRSAEDMGTHLRGQPVQVWLDGGAIKIAALG